MKVRTLFSGFELLSSSSIAPKLKRVCSPSSVRRVTRRVFVEGSIIFFLHVGQMPAEYVSEKQDLWIADFSMYLMQQPERTEARLRYSRCEKS